MTRDDLAARLAVLGCVAPEEEAAALLEDHPDDATLARRLDRRATGEPLAWIVGWAELAGTRVHVEPGVYVPRPQTAELVHRAIARLPEGGRLADLCCGSGAIPAAVARARPDARTVGLDFDDRAVRSATRNDVRAARAHIGAVPLRRGTADVVTAVAPYVPTRDLSLLPADVVRHEPVSCLDGGDDGLDLVRVVVLSAASLLRSGGWLLLELGGDQDVRLAADLTRHGFEAAGSWRDEEGDLRGMEARRR